MKSTVTSIQQLLFTGCLLLLIGPFSYAQFVKDPYAEVYPERDFSIQQIKEKGFQKVVVWYNEYGREEGDEDGMQWSNYIGGYQCQKHVFPDGRLELSTYYYPTGYKEKAYQYYYLGKKVSAIDQLSFDSLQNEKVKYSYNFVYKDTIPFQKVKLHGNDKQFRIMYDYLFDKEGQLVRLQITPHGQAKKMETLVELEQDNMMILVSYSKDAKTIRYYRDLHDLIRSERTQFTEDGKAINTRIKDGDNLLVADIGYAYEGEFLIKETHTVHDGTQLVEDKVIHYRYNGDGLMEQKIIEKGDQQIIFGYQYSEDY